MPRDLIVLLDTSGSMGGGPLDKAKQVVALMIDSLGEEDRLELIEFSNEPRRYRDEPVAATGRAKQRRDQVGALARRPSGGTEMRAAVIEALTTLRVGRAAPGRARHRRLRRRRAADPRSAARRLPASCRLHVLGVGSAVNRSLATSLARAGRGAEVIVGLDEDAERGAKRLLDRTRLPMLTNVEIAGSALLRHAPEQVPDVFEGAPLVAALALRAEGGELVVRGQLATERGSSGYACRRSAPARATRRSWRCTAASASRMSSRARCSTASTARSRSSGSTFQIATRMTSWVAVDESRVDDGPVARRSSSRRSCRTARARRRSGCAPRRADVGAAPMLDDGDVGDELQSIEAPGEAIASTELGEPPASPRTSSEAVATKQ